MKKPSREKKETSARRGGKHKISKTSCQMPEECSFLWRVNLSFSFRTPSTAFGKVEHQPWKGELIIKQLLTDFLSSSFNFFLMPVKQIENKWLVVEFTSFGEVLSRGELFLSNPRATSPGRTKHKQIAAKQMETNGNRGLTSE